MADMPRILDCSVTDCSYNKEKNCGAAAITVGYSTSCTTFIPLTVKGGLGKSDDLRWCLPEGRLRPQLRA